MTAQDHYSFVHLNQRSNDTLTKRLFDKLIAGRPSNVTASLRIIEPSLKRLTVYPTIDLLFIFIS